MYNLLSLMFYVAACGENVLRLLHKIIQMSKISPFLQNREDDTTDSNSGNEEGSSVVVKSLTPQRTRKKKKSRKKHNLHLQSSTLSPMSIVYSMYRYLKILQLEVLVSLHMATL